MDGDGGRVRVREGGSRNSKLGAADNSYRTKLKVLFADTPLFILLAHYY